MILFGHNTFNMFRQHFIKYFSVEYSTHCDIVRIRDNYTQSCILNVKLPLLISRQQEDILKSLYIQIFKFDSAFPLRYDIEDANMFEHVYNTIHKYYDEYICKRLDIEKEIHKSTRHVAIEHANNLFFNRLPSHCFKESIKEIEYHNNILREFTNQSINNNEFLI